MMNRIASAGPHDGSRANRKNYPPGFVHCASRINGHRLGQSGGRCWGAPGQGWGLKQDANVESATRFLGRAGGAASVSHGSVLSVISRAAKLSSNSVSCSISRSTI